MIIQEFDKDSPEWLEARQAVRNARKECKTAAA